jgi:hypothetical protein
LLPGPDATGSFQALWNAGTDRQQAGGSVAGDEALHVVASRRTALANVLQPGPISTVIRPAVLAAFVTTVRQRVCGDGLCSKRGLAAVHMVEHVLHDVIGF